MRIYIIMPYGRRRGLSDAECEKNIEKAIEVARQLILMGHEPLLPHLLHFIHKGWAQSPSEERWAYIAAIQLLAAEAVLVTGEIQDSDEGSNMRKELAQAKIMTKKIFYSLQEVKDDKV